MADKPLKNQKGKLPITRHPLFPATVALWFGALFGLGSLAIRPSLLEAVVTTLQLDAVFASMAPPLGATARFLVALAMAVLGAAIGFALARKLADPQSEGVSSKRRKAAKPKQAADDVPAEEDSLAEDTEKFATGQRRRSLAIEEQPPEPDYGDRAPVPGSSPQIFDVAEFDLDGFEDAAPQEEERVEPGNEPAQEPAKSKSPLELDQTFSMAEEPKEQVETDPIEGAEREAAEIVAGPSKEIEEGADDATAWPGVRKPVAFAPPEPETPSSSPKVDQGPDRFELARLAAEKPGSVFDAKPAQPLFDKPGGTFALNNDAFSEKAEEEESASSLVPSSAPEIEPAPFAQPAEASTQASAEPAEARAAEPVQSEPEQAPAAFPSPTANPLVTDAKEGNADRIETADPGELSNVELLERLALSMKRRRERPAAPAPTAAIAQEGAEMDAGEGPSILGNATHASVATDLAPQAEEATPVATDAPFAKSSDVTETSSPPVELPAAMRPVELDDVPQEDELPAFVPPRHIGASEYAPAAEASDDRPPFAAPASQVNSSKLDRLPTSAAGSIADSDEEPEDEDELVLEEGYSSLLNLSRPGTGPSASKDQFVRIDEPEADAGEVEPVVVFPGQGARNPAPFAKPETPEPAEPADETPAEPSIPVHADGRPPFAPPPEEKTGAATAKKQDPEETERALRSALATLQRMSGAA